MTSLNSAAGMLAWKGNEFSTSKCVRRVRKQMRRLRPKDLWTSTSCGPWSRMPRINQKRTAQAREHKEKRAASRMISNNAMAIALDYTQKGVQENFSFPHAQSKREEELNRLREQGLKERPTRKLCDRCGRRPGRRLQCQICKKGVGPCCLITEKPVPLCKDCWEPEPEQSRRVTRSRSRRRRKRNTVVSDS